MTEDNVKPAIRTISELCTSQEPDAMAVDSGVEELPGRSAELDEAGLQENIINNANFWIAAFDLSGALIYWNKTAEIGSGYSFGDLHQRGNVWELLDDGMSSGNQSFGKNMLSGSGGISQNKYETVITTREGKDRVICWDVKELINSSGEKYGISCIGTDITDENLKIKTQRAGCTSFRREPVHQTL